MQRARRQPGAVGRPGRRGPQRQGRLIEAGPATLCTLRCSARAGSQGLWSDWGGAAYNAKIAFQDLGNDTSGNIFVPSDVPNGYLIYSYNMCARPQLCCGCCMHRSMPTSHLIYSKIMCAHA